MATKQQSATTTTTNATPTVIFNDGVQTGRSYHVVVHARETTALDRGDYGTWLIIATVFQNSEAAYVLTSTPVEKAGSETATLSWSVTIALNGSNQVVVTVTGAASTDISWEAWISKTPA